MGLGSNPRTVTKIVRKDTVPIIFFILEIHTAFAFSLISLWIFREILKNWKTQQENKIHITYWMMCQNFKVKRWSVAYIKKYCRTKGNTCTVLPYLENTKRLSLWLIIPKCLVFCKLLYDVCYVVTSWVRDVWVSHMVKICYSIRVDLFCHFPSRTKHVHFLMCM